MTPFTPSQEEVFHALMALLPRGRAWQTHDTGIQREDSVLQQLLFGLAAPLAEAESAISAVAAEFFCATASETLDLWMEEYGLPSETDLFGEAVCAKASCLGGGTASYYEAIALLGGWATTMRWLTGDDAEFPGVMSTLHVRVDGANSPAGGDIAYAGLAECGVSSVGLPDVSRLIAGLERITPAHCAITYEVF
jgi:hypothetical protein